MTEFHFDAEISVSELLKMMTAHIVVNGFQRVDNRKRKH